MVRKIITKPLWPTNENGDVSSPLLLFGSAEDYTTEELKIISIISKKISMNVGNSPLYSQISISKYDGYWWAGNESYYFQGDCITEMLFEILAYLNYKLFLGTCFEDNIEVGTFEDLFFLQNIETLSYLQYLN